MNFNLKYASGDLDTKYKKTKRLRNLAIAGIPLGFLMFGGGMPLTILSEQIYLVFIPILGFCFIPASIICLAFSSTRLFNMKQAQESIKLIKSQDRTYFFQLAGGSPAVELQVATFVGKLIENGLLEGYSVVGGIAVVKNSAGFTEKSIMRDYALLRFGKTDDKDDEENYPAGSLSSYAEKKYGEGDGENVETKECYFCHANVPKDAVYCSKCGARLNY